MSMPVPSEDAQPPRGQFFRANVGIAVLDAAGAVLALERYGHAGSWLHWDQVQLLGEHPDWLAYELDAEMRKPDTGRGQVQKWFYVRLVDPEGEDRARSRRCAQGHARVHCARVDELRRSFRQGRCVSARRVSARCRARTDARRIMIPRE